MDYVLEEIRHELNKLKTGQCITVSREFLSRVTVNPFTGQSPIDRVLEGIVGSSYNLRHWIDPRTGDVTFERVKEDGRKWYEPDPDRRHWFEEAPDGSLRPKCNAEAR